ncbi:hypothetical protein [Commensalibacter sp. Nvir]
MYPKLPLFYSSIPLAQGLHFLTLSSNNTLQRSDPFCRDGSWSSWSLVG